MNAIGPWSDGPRVFMRSLATRDFGSEISAALPDVLAAVKVAGFDLVIVETSGIGQGDAAIVPLVDVPVYVMTPEFGAASQLEKIDMLDFAEFVAINKFDRKGAADALRDVAKQVQRNREAFGKKPDEMPVFGTMASRFNDDGVTALYQAMLPRLAALGLPAERRHAAAGGDPAQHAPGADRPRRPRPLPRRHRRRGARLQEAGAGAGAAGARGAAAARERAHADRGESGQDQRRRRGPRPGRRARGAARPASRGSLLAGWPELQRAYAGDEFVVKVRDREIRTSIVHTTLSGNKIRKVALPALRGPRRDPEVAAARQRARRVPLRRRHLRLQARERGPDPDVRRRRRRLQDQHAASSCSRPACRPSASRPRSTRSRSTATTRRSGPTSTARSATRASRSPRSTT